MALLKALKRGGTAIHLSGSSTELTVPVAQELIKRSVWIPMVL